MKSLLLKLFFISFAFVIASSHALLAQCAMCRSTVENNVSYGETSVASGLNYGIIYLFATPYLLFAVLAYLWYRKSQQAKKGVRVQRYPS